MTPCYYLPGVIAFRIKDDEFFPKIMLQENVITGFHSIISSKWWKIMEKSTKFFLHLSCLASSASINVFFSTFGFVWSKLRNWIEKATKLVKLFTGFCDLMKTINI